MSAYEEKMAKKRRLVALLRPLLVENGGNVRTTYELAHELETGQSVVVSWMDENDSVMPNGLGIKKIARNIGRLRGEPKWLLDDLDHYLETGEYPDMQTQRLTVEEIEIAIKALPLADVARLVAFCSALLVQNRLAPEESPE